MLILTVKISSVPGIDSIWQSSVNHPRKSMNHRTTNELNRTLAGTIGTVPREQLRWPRGLAQRLS